MVTTLDDVRQALADVLQLGDRARGLQPESALLGALPELDSMAVVSLIASLEERFGIVIDDDEIDASIFATLGSLAEFCEQKLAA